MFPSPTARPPTPPPSSREQQLHHPPPSPIDSQPLAKRPRGGSLTDETDPATNANPTPTAEPIASPIAEPIAAPMAEPMATSASGTSNPSLANLSNPSNSSDSDSRPSLPSMATLMSPTDPVSLPPPPNTAVHPPPALFPPTAVPLLAVKLLATDAKAPTRGSAFAAGYDLYAAEDKEVPPWGKALVGTGIAVAIPGGCYGRIAPRSGLAVKHSIATGAGVIDEDYRGEVKILLFNHSATAFEIKAGDRVAQMVLERIVTPEVSVVETLEDSLRGAGGFGSTGGFGVGF